MTEELKFPALKWAQNEERVWITIDLIDAEQPKTIVDIDEEKNTLEFKSVAGGVNYGFNMKLKE